MKKPMVSTSLGCEGIDVRHREHLLIADDPDAFAGAVLELLDSPALGGRLAEQGYELVLREYQWSSIVERLELFYGELVGARVGGTAP